MARKKSAPAQEPAPPPMDTELSDMQAPLRGQVPPQGQAPARSPDAEQKQLAVRSKASSERETAVKNKAPVSRSGSAGSDSSEGSTGPWLTDFDLHLFAEGTHERIFEKMGAHLTEQDGQAGVYFAVWAPNARRVSVIGEFNHWDDAAHQMSSSSSGVWTLFIPSVGEHTVYKYRVVSQNDDWFDKADPYGFAMEERPRTGSVVADLERYEWQDAEWLRTRAERQGLNRPISIYEVHLGSWREAPDPEWGARYLTYRELADELIPYVVQQGFTHIELLPITEHPLDASWGYQVLGFYAATSRFGPPQDLMYLIDRCHQEGLGVILDWVPAHFPKDGSGLNYFDGTHLYSHADPRQGMHQDWGTLIFNYSRNEVRCFLISNALFWIEKFHFDGLRVDAVASMLYLDFSREVGEWLPNEYGGRENLGAISFLRKMNEVVHGWHPGVLTAAEESTSWPMVTKPPYVGGLGFSLKWNMGWMHDFLHYMEQDPIFRKYHQSELTFSLLYAFSENFVLPLSHDEVVHLKKAMLTKMPGDEWQRFANLRVCYGFMWSHPGKKLLFMGSEFAQWQEWNFATSLEWDALKSPQHQGIQRYVRDLNLLYRQEPSLYENDFEWTGFTWIDGSDTESSVVAFTRNAHSSEDCVVVVCNFTPVVRHQYRIGVPRAGAYREILNSDSGHYGGSNVVNEGRPTTEATAWQGYDQSLVLTLPPLASIYLKLVTG